MKQQIQEDFLFTIESEAFYHLTELDAFKLKDTKMILKTTPNKTPTDQGDICPKYPTTILPKCLLDTGYCRC